MLSSIMVRQDGKKNKGVAIRRLGGATGGLLDAFVTLLTLAFLISIGAGAARAQTKVIDTWTDTTGNWHRRELEPRGPQQRRRQLV